MKREDIVGYRTYSLKNGEQFIVRLYKTNSTRVLVSLRPNYGHLDAYIKPKANLEYVDQLVNSFIKKNPGTFLNRDFLIEDKFVFINGARKLISHDAKTKNNPDFFYVPPSHNIVNSYKKHFIDYAYQRTNILAKQMNIPFDGYQIRAGRFISMYGNCTPALKTIKYDFRLYAYKTDIFDAIIIHELSHIIYLNHSKKFYNLVYQFCPEYDDKLLMIKKGWFRGEEDGHKNY